MAQSQPRIPGPDHPITTRQADARVTVTVAGRTIADTSRAVELREASYPPVHYIPKNDVDMAALTRTDHSSYCPYKGHASYFSIPAAGARGINAVWSYEAPYDAVAEIGGLLAFYPDRVELTVRPGG